MVTAIVRRVLMKLPGAVEWGIVGDSKEIIRGLGPVFRKYWNFRWESGSMELLGRLLEL